MENIYIYISHISQNYPRDSGFIFVQDAAPSRGKMERCVSLPFFFLRWRCFGEPKDADLTWENDGYPGISAPTVLGAIYLEITWDGGLLDQSGRAKSRPTAPKWAQERFAKPKERFTRSMHAPCCLDSHKQCKDICTAGGNAQDPERNPPAPPDIKVDLLPPLWVATLIPGERGQVRVRISTYITRKQR